MVLAAMDTMPVELTNGVRLLSMEPRSVFRFRGNFGSSRNSRHERFSVTNKVVTGSAARSKEGFRDRISFIYIFEPGELLQSLEVVI